MVGTLGIKHWNCLDCFLTDALHGCLSLSYNPCLVSGKTASKMIFLNVKAGHTDNTMFIGNIRRSSLATGLKTLCLEIILNVPLSASWKDLLFENNWHFSHQDVEIRGDTA